MYLTSNYTGLLANILCFSISMLCMVKIKLVGDIYISELMLFVVAWFYILNKFSTINEFLKTLLLLLSLWLIGQIFSDIVNNTSIIDRLKGQIRIVFFAFDILGLYFLTRTNVNRIFVLLLGFAFGQIVAFLIFPSDYAIDYPWKFGLAIPLGMIVTLVSSLTFNQFRTFSTSLLIAFGIISILLAGRSIGGIFILTGIVTGYLGLIQNTQHKHKSIYIFMIVVTITVTMILQGYSYVAENGYLGEVSRWKYLHQSSSTFGLLLSGRIEILVSMQAIADAPIIGHGSWARDWKYIDILQRIREVNFEQSYVFMPEDNLIPSHSHIFGAWVEAGILGALVWFYIITIILKSFYQIFGRKTEYLPLIIWALIMLTWDLLFSPLGAYQRLLSGFYILILLYTQNNVFLRKGSTE